jgi:hypothetical protein
MDSARLRSSDGLPLAFGSLRGLRCAPDGLHNVILPPCRDSDSRGSSSRARSSHEPAARAAGGTFSIAVLPDTQNMIDYKHQKARGFPFDASALFLSEMRWIADHAASRGGDVVFAAAVGDVWQHQSLAIDPAHATRGFKAIPNRWFAGELEARRDRSRDRWRAGHPLLARRLPGVAQGSHDYDAMWSDSRFEPVSDARRST